jgi:hypothetical protein
MMFILTLQRVILTIGIMRQNLVTKYLCFHKIYSLLKKSNLRLPRRIYGTRALLVVIAFPVFTTASDWVLQKNSNDIKVYTRDVSGSDYKEIKVDLTVKSTLAGVSKVFNDVPATINWSYNCTQAKVLKKISTYNYYVYNVFTAPWPVSDRDVITHVVQTQDTATKVITVKIVGVKDYIPEKEGLVRVESTKITATFTPLKGGLVQIIYQIHTNPGGLVPGYLVNLFVYDAPFNSFLSFKKIVSKPENCNYKSKDIKEL